MHPALALPLHAGVITQHGNDPVPYVACFPTQPQPSECTLDRSQPWTRRRRRGRSRSLPGARTWETGPASIAEIRTPNGPQVVVPAPHPQCHILNLCSQLCHFHLPAVRRNPQRLWRARQVLSIPTSRPLCNTPPHLQLREISLNGYMAG